MGSYGITDTFPFRPNSNISQYIEKKILQEDTLILFIKSFNDGVVYDTLRNKVIVKSYVLKHTYVYYRRRYKHIFDVASDLRDVLYVKMIFANKIYVFEKECKFKYKLKYKLDMPSA